MVHLEGRSSETLLEVSAGDVVPRLSFGVDPCAGCVVPSLSTGFSLPSSDVSARALASGSSPGAPVRPLVNFSNEHARHQSDSVSRLPNSSDIQPFG